MGKRSHADYAYFVARGDRAVTPEQIVRALGPPMRVRIDGERDARGDFTVLSVTLDGVEWIRVVNVHDGAAPGFEVSVVRKAASDRDWHTAQELPLVLGATHVASAHDFSGTLDEWLEAIGKGRN